MRLGANGFPYETPEQWLQRVKELNTSTVTAPISCQDPPELKRTYRQLIQTHRLSVGEVGIWRNSLSPDPQERKAALEFSKGQLMLAEELGAGCCVNIAGARGQIWSGYYPENYSADAYALLVDTVREIVDSVKPSRTFYTIEPMQWMHPDSPDDYLKLLQDIDRDSVGVHLDYVNMINRDRTLPSAFGIHQGVLPKAGASYQKHSRQRSAFGPWGSLLPSGMRSWQGRD